MHRPRIDVRTHPFKRAARGFDCGEVQAFLEHMAADYDEAHAERDRLQEAVAAVAREIEQVRDTDRSLMRLLATAEEDARLRAAAARRDATRIMAAAEARAAELLAEHEQQRLTLEAEIDGIVRRRRRAQTGLLAVIEDVRHDREAAPGTLPGGQSAAAQAVADPPAAVSEAADTLQAAPVATTSVPETRATLLEGFTPRAAGPMSEQAATAIASSVALPHPQQQEQPRAAARTPAVLALPACPLTDGDEGGNPTWPADDRQLADEGPGLAGVQPVPSASDRATAGEEPVAENVQPPARPGTRRWLTLAGSAAAIVCLAALAWPSGRSAPLAAANAASEPAAVARGDAPAEASLPVPAHADPLVVRLAAGRECWVRLTVDGRTESRTLAAGEELTRGAKQAVVLRVGDASAVTVDVNGTRLPPLGRDGQVVDRTFQVGSAFE